MAGPCSKSSVLYRLEQDSPVVPFCLKAVSRVHKTVLLNIIKSFIIKG
jgi:hypothetical protein